MVAAMAPLIADPAEHVVSRTGSISDIGGGILVLQLATGGVYLRGVLNLQHYFQKSHTSPPPDRIRNMQLIGN